MAEDIKYLDYEGLKTLVACVMSEMPVFDDITIIKNKDGKFSAKTVYEPTVSSDGSMVFSVGSPIKVSGDTLIFS